MTRTLLVFIAIASSVLHAQVTPQSPPAVAPHHDPGFESERKQADELFLAQKPLEALPLYADLCRQDSTIAVFAERHGAGLLAKAATLSNSAERMKMYIEAINELRRAQSLGDNSAYVRTELDDFSKTFVGAVLTGIPLTVGYTYRGSPAAQASMQEAEAAFGRSDWSAAVKLYEQAASIDPGWYDPALFAGDSYFRLKDSANAGVWFARAIAIDPNRETAYRYWGDALCQAGQWVAAREKFVDAVVAEPYAKPPFSEIGEWAQRTGHRIVQPAITRPEFTTPNGILKIDPELAASTQGGMSSWIVYQQYRVAQGARTLNQLIVAGASNANAAIEPKGYRHTIAEEHTALLAMISDVDARLKAGTLIEANLDPSIRNIRNLEQADMLGAWIAIDAADAGIRSDYPEYRSHHRQHLIDYINSYRVR